MQQIRMTFTKAMQKSSPLFTIIAAAMLFALGMLMLVQHETVLHMLLIAILVLIGLNGLGTALELYTLRKRKEALVSLLVYASLGGVIWAASRFLGLSIVRILGLWMIANGFIRSLICVQCIWERLHGVLRHSISAAVLLVFGLSLIIHPSRNVRQLMFLVGIYLLLLGGMALIDAISEMLDIHHLSKGRRRVRIPLPLFAVVLIPRRALDRFNAFLAKGREYQNAPSRPAGDLEILVHVGETGTEALGHVDICYKGLIYTFGAYDEGASHLRGAFSDGVILVTEREPYLAYRLSGGKEFLTGYTATLNAEQMEIIDHQLAELFSCTIPWQSKAERASLGLLPADDYRDLASMMYRLAHTKTYKVAHGKFRKYFVFSTNCVALADYLVGPAGLDMRGLDGIITPGAYYVLLDDMFQRGGTMVTAKNVYRDIVEEAVPIPEGA